MLASDTVPTLSYFLGSYNDWFNWYYDCSDIHYLRGELAPGTYYVGVTNDAFRATQLLFANLTLRTDIPGQMPCLLDCNGQGECDQSTGDCRCNDGWAGSVVNAPDTCQFQIKKVEFDTRYTSEVRIGNWDYYELPEIKAGDTTSLLVEFYSESLHAYPAMFVRHGEIPRLKEGFLPTYDAFIFDFGDETGFEYVQGQRMSVLVNSTNLNSGTYYIGVYNIWGHNGAERYNSHDTCSYHIKAMLFTAGTPCPSTINGFCDGLLNVCDFNTGNCLCPTDRLWRDCSFHANELNPHSAETLDFYDIEIEDSVYFLVEIQKKYLRENLNLLVTVEVLGGKDSATPLVLARFGELPFANDKSKFDDHDLLSNFYEDSRHQILLDAQELTTQGAGQWYIAVMNPETASSSLSFSIKAEFLTELDCPSNHNNIDPDVSSEDECSAAGMCIRELGRCDCDEGHVLDDCSADGIFALYPGSFFPWDYSAPPHSESKDDDSAVLIPPIAPDDWVYFSVIVGCKSRSLRVYFSTSNDGAAPLLVIRRGRLPLMISGTYDYWDYYNGETKHEPTQQIYVTPCGDLDHGCGDSCCIAPHYPGTTFATGAPEPGMYYIGVYNDKSARETISDYFLRVDVDASFEAEDATLSGCPEDSCAPGFLGFKCLATCPGVAPTDAYSNSPTGDDQICGGSGVCSFANDDDFDVTVCACSAHFTGPDCDLQCPEGHVPGSADDDDTYQIPQVCGGRGKCVTIELDGELIADCDCDEGFGGSSCLESCEDCGNHGTCEWLDSTKKCVCDPGYVGDLCDFQCPMYSGDICSDRGECILTHAYDGSPLRAACECNYGYYGDSCALSCPQDCSGHGACIAVSSVEARCKCFTAYGGDACDQRYNTTSVVEEENLSSSSSSNKKTSVSHLTTAFFAIIAIVLLTVALAAFLLAEKRKREISRYEALVREVGAASSTVITAAGATYHDSEAPIGDYTAPSIDSSSAEDPICRQIGNAPLPDFTQMRNVNTAINPFHTERVDL